MFNADMVAILKGGVSDWNEWREQHPEINPDLRDLEFAGANLVGANLRKVDLRGANLRNANMREADLAEADLRNADFHEANLAHANLSGANLTSTSLFSADLTNANFDNADLTSANLRRADLRDATLVAATLNGVNFWTTNLRGADLRKSSGLTCAILVDAGNWEDAMRDAELDCGKPIPVEIGEATADGYQASVQIGAKVDLGMEAEVVKGGASDERIVAAATNETYFEGANPSSASEAFADARLHLITNRSSVIAHAGEVKELVTTLQHNLQILRLNTPEAARALETLADMAVALDKFALTLQESTDDNATDEAQRIHTQALIDILQAWYDNPGSRVVLGTVAMSIGALCGIGAVGTAIIGATLIGPGPVGKLLEGLKGIFAGKTSDGG